MIKENETEDENCAVDEPAGEEDHDSKMQVINELLDKITTLVARAQRISARVEEKEEQIREEVNNILNGGKAAEGPGTAEGGQAAEGEGK